MKTFRLILTVTFDPAGVSDDTLKDHLQEIANHAADQGMMTGDTEATVEEWHAKVEEVL